MIQDFLTLHILRVRNKVFVIFEGDLRGIRDHSDCKAAWDFEDVGIVHHFESTIDMIGKTIKFAYISIESELNLNFFFLPRIEF